MIIRIYAAFFVAVLFSCQKDQPNPVTSTLPVTVTPTTSSYSDGNNSVQLFVGNPSATTTNPDNLDNYLLIKDQYVVSYNNSLGRANWVSWHLQKSDLGAIERQDDFRPDATLPTGFYPVKPADYTSADGFDRGHLCSSGDRTDSKTNNSATFLMTNMIPQAPSLNRGVWEELEAYCRELVNDGNELYIMAGGYGVGATGAQGFKTILTTSKVKPPAQCWKIIIALPIGDNDLSRMNAQTTVIAVDMLNSQAVRNGWEDYIVSISDIEKATQYTFLSALPADTRAALKAKKYALTPVATGPTTVTATSPGSTTTSPTTTTTTSPSTGDAKCGIYNGKQLYIGPKGGCYYINNSGNKTYVDRSNCHC